MFFCLIQSQRQLEGWEPSDKHPTGLRVSYGTNLINTADDEEHNTEQFEHNRIHGYFSDPETHSLQREEKSHRMSS